MRRKELRINDIHEAINRPELEAIQKTVDTMYLKFDHDKSGSLDSKELGNMLKDMYKEGQINILPTEGQTKEFIAEIDSNQNGKIEKREMVIFIRKLLN